MEDKRASFSPYYSIQKKKTLVRLIVKFLLYTDKSNISNGDVQKWFENLKHGNFNLEGVFHCR